MKRNVSLEEISDGKLYQLNDMVKADCRGCEGCSKCCQGMGSSIILDPYDVYRLTTGLCKNFQKLLENEIELKQGIYAQLTGPSFESPAEIQMFHKLGIDAVGMSTVVEAIAANHMGMKICCISFISNLAAGMNPNPLTHAEVQEAADLAAPRFKKLVTEVVKKFGERCI